MGIFSMGPSNDGSIFRTQANTQFNSFNNPMPTLNMSGPGWGVDQSYLTPSYASLYRPGSQEEPITSARPGFFHSAHNQLNPFASRGYGPWSDPFLAQQQYRENFVPKAVDAGMWTTQNIGVGTASFWLAGKTIGSMAKMGGHAGGGAMGAAWGESLFSSTARGAMGKMAGSNIGGAMGISGAAGMAGRGAGFVFGSIALPLLFAQGMVEATDAAVFNPYANQRNTGRSLRENFSGIAFGGGESGSPYSGRGLSFSSSNKISADVTRSGMSNWSMSGKEVMGISDLASRAGLLDNVNPKDFAKQITSITKQVAIIAAVANDPDFRNSIEIMAKLKDAGLAVNKAGSFMSQIGGHASVAGISTKRMMELGTQGQFIYGANNMTPYLGMAQYAQSYASFSAASRNGLVSPELLARMGGISGATQSSLTGIVNSAQTPYNQMMLANQYMFNRGGSSGSISKDLSAFGLSFAGNPVGAYGAMGLNAGAMMSAQSKGSGGILAAQRQAINMASSMGQLNSNGTIDDGVMYQMLKSQGLDHSAAEAMTVQLRNARDPKQYQNILTGERAAFLKDRATIMDQTGTSGLEEVVRIKSSVKNSITSLQQGAHDRLKPVHDLIGSFSDSAASFVDRTNFGSATGGSTGKMKIREFAAVKAAEKTNKNTVAGALESFSEWFGITTASDKSGNETYHRFWDDMKKAGISDSDFIRAYDQEKQGLDTELTRKVRDAAGTRRVSDAFGSAMENSSAILGFKESGYGTFEAYSRDSLNGRSLRDQFFSENQDIGTRALHGDPRLDKSGNRTAQELFRKRDKAYEQSIDDIESLRNGSRVVTSKYTEQVSLVAAEGQLKAAKMQLQASENMLKASGNDSSGAVSGENVPVIAGLTKVANFFGLRVAG